MAKSDKDTPTATPPDTDPPTPPAVVPDFAPADLCRRIQTVYELGVRSGRLATGPVELATVTREPMALELAGRVATELRADAPPPLRAVYMSDRPIRTVAAVLHLSDGRLVKGGGKADPGPLDGDVIAFWPAPAAGRKPAERMPGPQPGPQPPRRPPAKLTPMPDPFRWCSGGVERIIENMEDLPAEQGVKPTERHAERLRKLADRLNALADMANQ